MFSSCSSTQQPVIMSGESQGKWSEENLNAQRSYVTSSGQSNNLWVEFKSGHSGVSQGFQLTVLSVQGEDNSLGFLKSKLMKIIICTISEELGYLVEAIINTRDIATFDSDKEAGNLSHEDKILLSRYG